MTFPCDVSRILLGTPIMPTYEDGPLTPPLFPSNLFSQIWPLKGKGERTSTLQKRNTTKSCTLHIYHLWDKPLQAHGYDHHALIPTHFVDPCVGCCIYPMMENIGKFPWANTAFNIVLMVRKIHCYKCFKFVLIIIHQAFK